MWGAITDPLCIEDRSLLIYFERIVFCLTCLKAKLWIRLVCYPYAYLSSWPVKLLIQKSLASLRLHLNRWVIICLVLFWVSALGAALGRVTEFLETTDDIRARYGPHGVSSFDSFKKNDWIRYKDAHRRLYRWYTHVDHCSWRGFEMRGFWDI